MDGLLETFRPHYAELRGRLLRSLIAVLLCGALAYLFRDTLTLWCMRPLQAAFPQMDKLVYTSLPEALVSYLKLSLIVGFLASFPYLLAQCWLFAAPGLARDEKRLALRLILPATLLLACGAAFGFLVILPRLLLYLMAYAGQDLIPLLKLGRYLTFVGRTVLTFALAFEIPFLMVVTARLGLIRAAHFRERRLYFHGGIVILAFLLAAGDVTAALLLTLPLVALYEGGALLCRLFR